MQVKYPSRTLWNHLKSGSSEHKLGKRSILTNEKECDLENRCYRAFMCWYSRLSKRIEHSLSPASRQKLNRVIAENYFTKLADTLDVLDLKNRPQNSFNVDGKGHTNVQSECISELNNVRKLLLLFHVKVI
ncbi:hypothetical protein PR048_013842 [Dryococelus australis]|uniref:Uncharacterized protein n=1 Tax=Dryococelus australis TaxID=614101 RepID=A0ABQ9HTA9_9NEOP|nr:hypothetical protein PR048_013842 [Dryococelus australis]